VKTAKKTAPAATPGPYQVRLDPDIRREWAQWCAERGLIQGVAVSRALQAFMEQNASGIEPAKAAQ
jgi:hypothetical protein